MIFNPKYHICIIFQVKVEQNTFEIIEIVSQMNIKMALYFFENIYYTLYLEKYKSYPSFAQRRQIDLKRSLILSKHTLKRYMIDLCAINFISFLKVQLLFLVKKRPAVRIK